MTTPCRELQGLVVRLCYLGSGWGWGRSTTRALPHGHGGYLEPSSERSSYWPRPLGCFCSCSTTPTLGFRDGTRVPPGTLTIPATATLATSAGPGPEPHTSHNCLPCVVALAPQPPSQPLAGGGGGGRATPKPCLRVQFWCSSLSQRLRITTPRANFRFGSCSGVLAFA